MGRTTQGSASTTIAAADTWLHATVHEDQAHDTLEVRLERANVIDAIDAALALRYRVSTLGGCEVTATDKTHPREDHPSLTLVFAPAGAARRALARSG